MFRLVRSLRMECARFTSLNFSAASGLLGFLSGWYLRASFRYVFLMSSAVAVFGKPSVWYNVSPAVLSFLLSIFDSARSSSAFYDAFPLPSGDVASGASDESGQSARKQVVFFFRDFFPSSFWVYVMMIDDCGNDGSEPESCSSLSSGLVCFYPSISTFLLTPRHGQLADNRSVTDPGMYHSEKRYFQEFFTPQLIFTRFRIFFAFFLCQPTHCTRTDDDDRRFPHNTLSLSLSMKFFHPPAQI